MPISVFDEVKKEIPEWVGVYTVNNNIATCIIKPKRQDLRVEESVLKDSFIRSQNRYLTKTIMSNDETIINGFKSKIRYLEKQIMNNELTRKDHLSEIHNLRHLCKENNILYE
jgi:hypothetical protein